METNPNAFQHEISIKPDGNNYFPLVAITNLDHAKMLHLAKGEIVGFAHEEEVEMNYIETTNVLEMGGIEEKGPRNWIPERTMGYLDDSIIFSNNEVEHLHHIEEIFNRLEPFGLKMKREKCDFFKRHIQYLGHLIAQDGYTPLPEKLESIRNMPRPKTPKEVNSS